ncbi:TIGR03087 family PEP-CTERM/XrtA system glycosyltransferase [Denitrobaculum tricleocarpae]|uniref:TIGR03087 family PEP-CTERM/XrtA system glycosyltransferase n=1 Tax=Denitrobaculum tricleocarpae TaxID=2591009 RepID=A0A545TG98_9PROT|nr:TIGR03087 family PEP-CTERM/XrtA system glycosyltransferase [Denitrobaculum tricleocarpae]TQV76247.1 TIGR03087 family PEP-CTERM/XrtA system glycosyltransferase [Denitrobaculum tricleocarpae]
MSVQPELLFLSHRIPYPPDKGDKIRSWNILKGLAEQYRVHLGCFIDDEEDLKYADHLRGVCDRCHFARLNPLTAKLWSSTALLNGDPLTLSYYKNAGLQRWVDDLARERDLESVFVFSGAVAQYIPASLNEKVRRIVDFVDVDSDKWRQYADSKPWPASWIYDREGRKLLEFERKIAAQSDAGLFVSPAEAAFFRKLAPESSDKISHINNGVDFEFFDPAQAFESPFSADERPLVFTGAMDYWPNADAVIWFAEEILPRLREKREDVRFYVVGSKPGNEVKALARRDAVTVTGRVEDVRPYIAHAAAVVAPLRISRGVQNKVLEGMAMARPVVATSQALEGIDASYGEEVLKADDPNEFIGKIIALLDSDKESLLGKKARARVMRDYAWSANIDRLTVMLKGTAQNMPV